MIDTLSYYNEVIKYKKTYNLPKSKPLISFDTDSSDSDSDDSVHDLVINYNSDSDDSDLVINYNSDSDSY